MTRNQENKLKSMSAVKTVIDENADIIVKYPPIKENSDEFISKYDEVKVLTVRQEEGASGISKGKKQAKERLAVIASEVAACGFAYASKINNPQMADLFDYEYSDIRYRSDEQAANISQAIFVGAIKHKDLLKANLLDDEDLSELQSSISQFSGSIGKQGSDTSADVINTRRIKTLIKEIDQLLENVLDKQVQKIQRKEPLLSEIYFKARDIKDLGKRKRSEDPAEEPGLH